MPQLAASVSMLFQEVALLERFDLAAAAGFRAVEIQRPYEEPAEALAERIQQAGLEVALLNMPAALAAVPGEQEAFRETLKTGLRYCGTVGAPRLHCLAGWTDDPAAEATFVANLKQATAEAAARGVRLLIEPLNTQDMPGYFLTGSAQGRRIIDQVGSDNLGLQFDLYHMTIMEGGLAETLRAQFDVIEHVQVAGVPGRHEPDGEQEVDVAGLFALIDDLGYEGWVGCEYTPRGETLEGLGWAAPYGIGATAAAD